MQATIKISFHLYGSITSLLFVMSVNTRETQEQGVLLIACITIGICMSVNHTVNQTLKSAICLKNCAAFPVKSESDSHIESQD